jgi:hypothetical protein
MLVSAGDDFWSAATKEATMAEAKTKPTSQSVESFINKVSDPQTRQDCFAIAKLMKEATRSELRMWGSSIVGSAPNTTSTPAAAKAIGCS